MKTLLDKTKRAWLAALCLAVCAFCGVRGADPVAEWGAGDFPQSEQNASAVASTKGDYTLTKNTPGNISAADGITIKGWPAVITPSTAKSAITVIVGYKAPSATASGAILQFGNGSSGANTKISANLVGGSLALGWEKTYAWGDSNSAATGITQPDDEAVHFVTLASSYSNGTTIWFDGFNKVRASGLKWSGMSFSDITLGAIRGPENIFTDAEYKYVAVYDEALSDADALAAYRRAKAAISGVAMATPSIDGENNCVFTITEDSAYNVESAATYNSVTFNVASGKTLILTGATLTGTTGVTVNGGKVEVSSASALVGTLKGNGTLCYSTASPTVTGAAILACKTSDWTGTLWIRDVGSSSTAWQFDEYGSSKSTLRLTSVQGYLNYSNGTVSPTVDLYGRGLDVNNGNGDAKTTIEKLTGSGMLTVSYGSSRGNGLLIKDATTFAGAINVSDATRYTVTIGGTTCTSGASGKIIIADGAEVTVGAGKKWNGAGGVEINGTVNLASSSSSITGTITGATSGTVICDGFMPTISLTNAGWLGTLWLERQEITAFEATSYGSGASTIKMSDVRIYFNAQGNKNTTVHYEGTLEVASKNSDGTDAAYGIEINNGWTASGDNNTWSYPMTSFVALKGDGLIKDTDNGASPLLWFKDAHEFTGSINLAYYKRLRLGQGTEACDDNGRVLVSASSAATIFSGKTWSAAGGVKVHGILAFAGTGAANCNVITLNGSTVDFSQASSGSRISGTLTLASGTTIKLPAGATLPYQLATAGNGFIEDVTVQIGNETATTGTVCLSGGAITTLESVDIDTEKTYTVAEVFGTPSATSSYEINVTSDATLDIDAAITVDVIKFNIDTGKTLTISGSKLTAENVAVSGGGELVFAVSDTKTLARNAVDGAPYRVWLYKFSSLTGSVSIDESSVEVPTGYSYSVITTSQGVALEFTTSRQFGSLNINFPGGRSGTVNLTDARVSDNATYSGLMHGATPVIGTSWNDVPAQNASVAIAKYVRQDGSVATDGTATITLSGVNNPYTTGVNSGDRILFGYCDDGGNPQVVINNIPFAKYRVIAYAATDDSKAFCPKTINGVSYSTAAAGSSASPTIAGGTGAWGDSTSRSTLAEGVNYLVSDVISGTTMVTINNPKTSIGRASIAAVQIVEVGVANTFDIDAAGTYTPAGMFSSMSAGVAYEINVNESATLEIGSATTAGKVTFNVAAGKVLTLAGDGTLTAQTFVFDGAGKVATSDALRLSGILEGPGTFSVANVTYTNFRMVGESGKLIFSGVSGFGYAVAGTTNNRDGGTLELVDNGDTKALTISNGYSGFRAVFDALVGTGTFKSSHATQHIYVFKNASEFAGTIDLATGAKTSVVLGDDTETTPADGSVLIPSDSSATVANGKTWNAAGGIDVSGTLKFAGTGATSANVALGADGTLDFSAYSGATPAIAGAVTLNGGAIRLPAGATLPYQIAASGDGAPSYYTIGEGEPQTGVLLKNGSLVATRTATISSAEPVVFGEIGWAGSGDDYTLTLSAPTYLTFDSTKVDSLKIIVENDVGLYVNGDMPENTTIIGLTPLTIASGLATYYVGYTRLYSQIGTTENGNGALNESGSISVFTADGSSITAGNYTLARWLAPQIMGTGYGTVGTLTANVASGLSKELVYMTDRIVLRVYDATAQAARGTMRIMPFGDSITEGYNSGASLANYRAVLAQKLTLAGFNVEMAGVFDKIQTVNNSAGSMADAVDPSGTALPDAWKWHSAKHGATVGVTASTSRSAMIENVDTICSLAGPVDAILVLAGINDLAATGETVDTTFANWTSLVFRLCADRPEAKIIVSTMLGTDSRYSNSAALKTKSDALNALIKAQVAKVEGVDEGAFPAGRVVLADLNAYVTPGADGILSSDGLHPDWWGDDQMAQGWFDAIIDSGFMPDGTFASATIPAAPATADLGAAAKPELAGYISGFTRYVVLEADNGIDLENIPYTDVNASAPSENLAKVGYFVEYVEKDHHSHKWVWVDMDAFGTTIGDVGLPTVNKQQTVTSLHVKSNHNAIDNVEAQDHTVEGWIEFSPFTYTVAPSGVTGAPAAHSGAFDWNDTLAESGAQGCMQVFRKAPPSGRAAQTLFAFNNWNQSETEAEFGIGNFAQHFSGNGYQTLDYTETKGLEKVNASAFTVKRIEIWTRSALSEPDFTYNPYPGDNTPTGWITSWGGEWFSTTSLRVGPSSSIPYVYHTASGNHPWAGLAAKTAGFSYAIYADVSQMATSKGVISSFGNSTKGLILYRDGDWVKVAHIVDGGITTPEWVPGVAAGVGYHLYTVTFDPVTGATALYLDDGSVSDATNGSTKPHLGTQGLNAGYQLGSVYQGCPSGFNVGVGMAVAAVRGFDAVLQPGEVDLLSESFPATNGTVSWDVSPSNSANTYTVTSATIDDSHYLGITCGTLTIPEGSTVSTKHVRVLNNGYATDNATVNVAGTLNVTSTSTDPDVWYERNSLKGILFGHWSGTATYNVTGSLVAENAYLETVYTAGTQTININGGTVRVKGIWAYKDTSSINLAGGGTLEVAEIPGTGTDSNGDQVNSAAIALNFGYGTYCQKATGTVTHTMTFSGTQAQPTTLDPYGCQMTVNSMAGSGYIAVADSSVGGSGKVIFNGSAGTVMVTTANAANIDISSYAGTVLLTDDTTVAGAMTFANGLTLQFNDISGAKKLTLGSTLTFASGTVSIAIGAGASENLSDGKVLIGWTGAPGGDFAFADSALADAWTLEKTAAGLVVRRADIKNTSDEAVGYMEAGTAVITNPSGTITIPASATALKTVVNDGSVSFAYSGSGINAGNITVVPTDIDGNPRTDPTLVAAYTALFTKTIENGVITVALNESAVRQAVGTGTAASSANVQFPVTMQPGLWYAVQSGTGVGAGNALTGTTSFGTAVTSDTTGEAHLTAPLPTADVLYYKIAVGTSKAAVTDPVPAAEPEPGE